MRTIRRTLSILLFMACAVLMLSACVHAEAADQAGRYDAVSCSKDGNDFQYDGEYLLLKEDGTGEVQFNGGVYDITWSEDGNGFSFTDEDGEIASGRMEDGEIHLTYMGYDYVYVRNDTSLGGSIDASAEASGNTPDAEKTPESAAASSGARQTEGGPDVYRVSSREETSSGSGQEEASWNGDYIALNDDGTGVFLFNRAAFTIRWETDGSAFSFTDHLGNKFTGTMDSGSISGTYGKYRYSFVRTGESLPVYSLSPDTWGQEIPCVLDEAGVLDQYDMEDYTERAQKLAADYDVGVYVVIVNSRDNYTWSGDISTLSEEIRSGYSIGTGSTPKKEERETSKNPDWKDSILLTIAVRERKYDICVSGDYAVWAFPTYARESIRDGFLDDLKEDKWSDAVRDYLYDTQKVLKVAAKGKQYSFKTSGTGRLISFAVPIALALVFGYGVAAAMRGSMQKTQRAQNAAEYVAGDKVNFTRKEDHYIRTLVTRTYSPKEKSGSGGGGGSFSSSSGSSHTSGSF